MDAERVNRVGDDLVEEFIWNGKSIVYINNIRCFEEFETAIQEDYLEKRRKEMNET